ncbi:hypothetical protein OIU85_008336 [Salix viminalis]|uniref:Uncharacterized protein n=1 Tax=Salix viminalis TaxID=40686 RepID=A0A9Q0SH99_SALVM|nr:hypothetical protein OIU85_008336 [Salix viminalis]
MEVLLEKLNEIRQKLQENREKMRSYNPDVVNINAIHDANAHRQFLFDAIQNIEKLSMEIFHEPIDLQKSESLQVTLPATRDAHLTAEELVYANGNRNLSQDDHQPQRGTLACWSTPNPRVSQNSKALEPSRSWAGQCLRWNTK